MPCAACGILGSLCLWALRWSDLARLYYISDKLDSTINGDQMSLCEACLES